MSLKDGEQTFYPCESPFKIMRVDDRKIGKSHFFATNMVCPPKTVVKWYKRRLGNRDIVQ